MPVDFIPTIIPTPEITAQNPQQAGHGESAPAQETTPNPIPASSDDASNTPASQNTTNTDTTQQPTIVDKTNEPEKLHPVDSHADSLTTIADQEEEEFIEKVMEEHKS